jgi:hypothetical protein
MLLQEVTEPSEIIVCFTRGGEIAHALHHDAKTVLGPSIKFTSAETLEKALRYLGATDEQIAEHRKNDGADRPGQQSHPAAAEQEEPAPDRLRQAVGYPWVRVQIQRASAVVSISWLRSWRT